MSGVQSVIKKASKYSDGGMTPPIDGHWYTMQDKGLTIKHTSGSVEYNLDHAEDHLSELCVQLGKLCAADRKKCENLADDVCKYLDKVYNDVQVYTSPTYKAHDHYNG